MKHLLQKDKKDLFTQITSKMTVHYTVNKY